MLRLTAGNETPPLPIEEIDTKPVQTVTPRSTRRRDARDPKLIATPHSGALSSTPLVTLRHVEQPVRACFFGVGSQILMDAVVHHLDLDSPSLHSNEVLHAVLDFADHA